MPNPTNVEKSSNEPEVKIIPSETIEATREEVTLDANTGVPIETPAPVAPSVSPEEFRKAQARYEFQARQQEREMREMKELLKSLGNKPVVQAEKSRNDDDDYGPELDEIAKSDWKKGVSIVAQKQAERIAQAKIKEFMEERDKQQAEIQRNISRTQQLDSSKNRVLAKYPSLNDEGSEEFAHYVQILNEQPDLRDNPRGPEIAMYEMESRLKGKTLSPTNHAEEERLKRVAVGQAPQNRPTQRQNTITLTREELDMCKEKGLSPALYAQMKTANYKEGVSA